MEVFVVILLAVVLVAGAAAFITLRRPAGPELEPPAAPPLAPPATAPPDTASTAPTDVAVEGAPVVDDAPVEAPTEEPSIVDEAEAVLEAEAAAPPAPVAPPEKPRLRDRLGTARATLSGYLGGVRGRDRIDETTWEELEEALIRADVGVQTTMSLLDDLRTRVKEEGIRTPDELIGGLKDDIKRRMREGDRTLRLEAGGPNVWLFVGVNGVGKTTTIGKIGQRQVDAGHQVVMAAGDTFRAAAAEQLDLWAQRTGADVVRGAEGSDPGAVVFDAVQRAAARSADLVLADTAGRLHNKVNLMEELKKVRRVAEREPGRVTEVLLVIDATTGHNGLVQAREFTSAVGVTGVVLTKLDGTAKGGIALAIQTELGVPIKLVGLGETAADLIDFDPDEFVDALFE